MPQIYRKGYSHPDKKERASSRNLARTELGLLRLKHDPSRWILYHREAAATHLLLQIRTKSKLMAIDCCVREVVVPYSSGENPVLVDYVKNKWEQLGTVVQVESALKGTGVEDLVSVRWDDGGPDLPLTRAKEFALISRKA
jgi:hypothetical protein